MAHVIRTNTFATAPVGSTGASSAPDSITLGAGSVWVEYGNGADSTGASGSSTIVQYSLAGQVEHSYELTGLADGLKFDPATGDVWALMNNDGNSNLILIDPSTGQVSAPLDYAPPYVYGADSTRGFDDVVFDGRRVFLSETNPANSGDPVVVQLVNGNAPFGQLVTHPILSFGDTGTNLVTGQQDVTLPITDPDSLKLLPNGSLLLTGEADGAFIFINHPGTAQQSDSFVTLPSGDVPDDAIMPTTSSGTFYISNQGANDVIAVQVSGLNKHDLYADIANQNELAQLDPRTGALTPLVTGLNNPHGLLFVPNGHGNNLGDLLTESAGGLGGLLPELVPPGSATASGGTMGPSGSGGFSMHSPFEQMANGVAAASMMQSDHG